MFIMVRGAVGRLESRHSRRVGRGRPPRPRGGSRRRDGPTPRGAGRSASAGIA